MFETIFAALNKLIDYVYKQLYFYQLPDNLVKYTKQALRHPFIDHVLTYVMCEEIPFSQVNNLVETELCLVRFLIMFSITCRS